MYNGTATKLNQLKTTPPYTTLAPLLTIENGLEKVVVNHALQLNGQSQDKTFVVLNNGNPMFDLSYKLFEDCAKSIMILYFFADYRRIKEHVTFQKLYGYNPNGVVNYWDGTGVVPKFGPTFPCMRCGLILPANNITIDHQKPQQGGEVLAVTKSFRAIGMTKGGPVGEKGKAFAKLNDYQKMSSALIDHGVGSPMAPRDHLNAPGKDERNTLVLQGAVVYSALIWGGDKAQLYTNAMNSILNLKPLYLRCNTSKGNSILG